MDAEALNVQTGPGMGYPVVGWLISNDFIKVDGRAEGTLWVRISAGPHGHLDYGGLWTFGGYLLQKDAESADPTGTLRGKVCRSAWRNPLIQVLGLPHQRRYIFRK
jgi:hypothetical protein